MSIALYKPGHTHLIRGVHCEMRMFPNSKLQAALKAGWKADPNEVRAEAVKASDELANTAEKRKKAILAEEQELKKKVAEVKAKEKAEVKPKPKPKAKAKAKKKKA